MADSSDVQKTQVDPLQEKPLPEKKPFVNEPGKPFINNNPSFNRPWYWWWKFAGNGSGWARPTIRKHAARSR